MTAKQKAGKRESLPTCRERERAAVETGASFCVVGAQMWANPRGSYVMAKMMSDYEFAQVEVRSWVTRVVGFMVNLIRSRGK